MTEKATRQRVLLVAPTCDGEDVGEAWVAYQWARHLADRARRDGADLPQARRDGRRPSSCQGAGGRVDRAAAGWVGSSGSTASLKPGYLPFYLRARRWVRAGAGLRGAVRRRPPAGPGRDAVSLARWPASASRASWAGRRRPGQPAGVRGRRGRHARGSCGCARSTWRLRGEPAAAPDLRARRLRARHRAVRRRPAAGLSAAAVRGASARPRCRRCRSRSTGPRPDGRTGAAAPRRPAGAHQGAAGRRSCAPSTCCADWTCELDVVGDGSERAACEALVRRARPAGPGRVRRAAGPGRVGRALPGARTCSCSPATASPAATSSSRRWATGCRWWSATAAGRARRWTPPAPKSSR